MLADVMIQELERQTTTNDVGGYGLYVRDDGDTVMIDGSVDIEALAQRVAEVLLPQGHS